MFMPDLTPMFRADTRRRHVVVDNPSFPVMPKRAFSLGDPLFLRGMLHG